MRTLRDPSKAALWVLNELCGPGIQGKPSLLAMYHKHATPEHKGHLDRCEMPRACHHCNLVRKARAIMRQLKAQSA